MGETIAIVGMVVIAPLVIILHYVTKWKQSATISSEDEKMLHDLWQTAQKLEARINSLEIILDDEIPGWRNKS